METLTTEVEHMKKIVLSLVLVVLCLSIVSAASLRYVGSTSLHLKQDCGSFLFGFNDNSGAFTVSPSPRYPMQFTRLDVEPSGNKYRPYRANVCVSSTGKRELGQVLISATNQEGNQFVNMGVWIVRY